MAGEGIPSPAALSADSEGNIVTLVQYSIQQFSRLTGLPSPTLRYYESEGVLPFVKRDANGNRRYDEENIAWIDFVLALRSTGMGVADVRRYVELYQRGNETLAERKQMLLEHEERVRFELAEQQRHLAKIQHKLELYAQLEAEPDRTDIAI
jgi:DNA-binding transcriptional MerR regulator